MDKISNSPHHENNVSTLDNIFKRIIKTDPQIQLTLNILNQIIETELNLNLDSLDDEQKQALPYMLLRYIKNWPGWSKRKEYDDGSIKLESWMLRFRNYIYYKMKVLVTKTMPQIKMEDDLQNPSETVEKAEMSTQSESQVHFASFNIDLSGPPTLLNNLVFSGYGANIRVEEHAERPWVPLEYADILNYPFVEVEFNSQELSFKRSFEPKISHYLSRSSDFPLEESNFILGKSSMNSVDSKGPIKLSVLDSYIKALKCATSSQISQEQQEEMNCVLDQFFQDMVDISSNGSIFENRRVIFNIGRNTYRRTKKISNGDASEDIVFNEIFLPRLMSSLRHFTGTQNDKTKETGDQDKKMTSFKLEIIYKCTFCKMKFQDPEARLSLLKHLEKQHGRPQTLLCLQCKKCIEVTELSRWRWKCICF